MSHSHTFMQGAACLVMHEQDDVATVLRDVQSGESIQYVKGAEMQTLSTLDAIPFGHKVAITFIPQGATVSKYGDIIGQATQAIQVGEHVHIHNIEGIRGRGDLGAEDHS